MHRKKLKLATVVVLALPLVAPERVDSAPDESGPPRLMVVWGANSLRRSVETALDRIPGVHATTVRMGLDWLSASFGKDGKKIDTPPDGYAFPIEAAVIKPGGFSLFAPEAERATIASLRRGQALLSESAARLRGPVKRLRLRGRAVRVAGVVSDEAAQGHEMLLPPPVPASWPGTIRTVLSRSDRSVKRARLARAVRREIKPEPFRMKSSKETPFLRYAVSVRPLIAFKQNFGEFAARPSNGGPLDLAPGWTDRHIRTESVPILKRATCHKKFFPQLRGALRELKRKGKAHLIRPNEYAGCFSARFVSASPGIRISRHTWGIAVDLNTSGNGFGEPPNQPPALIKVMRKWELLWGGYWMTPDGMHFEWKRWP